MQMRCWTGVFLCLAGLIFLPLELMAQAAPAASGVENVLVVANRASKVSGVIARYYAQQRHVPAQHLCWIDTDDDETIERDIYDEEIEKPIRKCLVSRKLTEQVLYIVMTKGVPLHISGGGKELQADGASTDSELTLLYSRIHGKTTPIAGAVPNPFFRQTQTPFAHPLFPMYLVTRLDAYDVDSVKRMIDRALEAEQMPNRQGKVYLDMRDGSDEPGESWLRDTVILLPPGRGVLDQTDTVVYGKQDAIGYASWGSNDKKHRERRLNFKWLPGALATEYVSTDARTMERPPANWRIGTWANSSDWYHGSPQSMSGDFIEDGATGASGHVDEPYLHMTPHPDLLFPAYLSGRNLAESFYMSILGLSWMNIFLGDPLCHLKQ